ncbi:MAG: hypothetical protein A3A44_02385 [Candidatus Sungbacteria bacterium RIFCSPLOWO2_01_FULL_60_25]|uniref:Uncharacterized protein n=1 Tax=Candidatus Sungbacteria bacterium RIFCSPLOWO2_01_FULL_60_25 TaxID=1802281 RepID=A0A1G2LBV6_9BACT|nr:MAG: hypothetical protein A3A44_02385 [Candidatus Sungbacteria bacterium RIFCSPLOWO2_01_FULL_60_25]
MTPMITSTPSKRTEGQETKYRRLIEDAARHAVSLAFDKIAADQDGWQRVLERGDEVKEAIAEIVVAKTRELSVTNQFADEEVKSSYGYLSGYTKPKSITGQTNRLRELLPGIGYADEVIAAHPLTPGAEGHVAIPRWEKIAPTYGEAVEKVFALLKKTRDGKFVNYREGELGAKYLRQSSHAAKMWQKIGDEQKGNDILVVQAQFGINHRGRSIRRVREVMPGFEFGLGAFAIGIMLLTHPERLQHRDDLWIDCAGDEYSPDAGGDFSHAPFFDFYVGQLEFNASWVDDPSEDCGSASAFLPQ